MIRIRAMTAGDVPLGMRLSAQAGWNQTEADWRRLLEMDPAGCFVAELDGRPAATATACAFEQIGWIAAVLVDEPLRRRGIATALVEHAVAYLDRRGVRTMRLDATPLGRPIYQRLGFTAEYELVRLEGLAHGGAPHADVRPASAADIDAVLELDRRATATCRQRLIEHLRRQQPGSMHVVAGGPAPQRGTVDGYLMYRDGARATQIGPGVAANAESGHALVETVLARFAGRPVYLDIPTANGPAIRQAELCGLRVQRPFTRMRRGRPVADVPAQVWASSGPEHG